MQFSRERLKGVSLYPKGVHDSVQVSDVVLTWTVKNYSKLKTNKIYYQCTSSHNCCWTLKIVIARGTLFVFLAGTSFFKNVCFRICRVGSEQPMESPAAEKLNHRLFVSEFCNKVILDPKNEYLSDDKLAIQCKFEEKAIERVSFDTLSGELPYDNDISEVSKNLSRLYWTGLYSNFSIQVEDTTFWVHKTLLAARSKFFAEFFAFDSTMNSIALDATPNCMHEVLNYIYTGDLNIMIENDLLEVLKLADMLQIDVLVKKCKDFFKTHLSPLSIAEIIKLPQLHNFEDLRNVAEQYLQENYDFIRSCYTTTMKRYT